MAKLQLEVLTRDDIKLYVHSKLVKDLLFSQLRRGKKKILWQAGKGSGRQSQWRVPLGFPLCLVPLTRSHKSRPDRRSSEKTPLSSCRTGNLLWTNAGDSKTFLRTTDSSSFPYGSPRLRISPSNYLYYIGWTERPPNVYGRACNRNDRCSRSQVLTGWHEAAHQCTLHRPPRGYSDSDLHMNRTIIYEVEFLHRTMRDFFWVKEIRLWIEDRFPKGFSLSDALSRAFLIQLKTLLFEVPDLYEKGKVTDLVDSIMHYVHDVETQTGEASRPSGWWALPSHGNVHCKFAGTTGTTKNELTSLCKWDSLLVSQICCPVGPSAVLFYRSQTTGTGNPIATSHTWYSPL